MRIGELAGLVGITTRAVRHYHRIGLLPEPPRQSNGYREYSLRDAVELARIRRLVELGLGLDEVRDVLADDAGKELVEVLAGLDADLARQEDEIRERRARLADLLARAEAAGGLPAEGPVSPELAAVFADMAREADRRTGPEPAMAAKERRLLALLESSAPGGDRGWLDGMLHALGSDPQAVERAYEVYARLDELADAALDDPRIEAVARAVSAAVPDEAVRAMRLSAAGGEPADGGFADAFFADFAPAQAAAVRRAIELMQERAR
ncbi:MerR family transcriptional regulator [Kitasatospora sp. NPDC054939]